MCDAFVAGRGKFTSATQLTGGAYYGGATFNNTA